jgi:RecJ-like exonuclease
MRKTAPVQCGYCEGKGWVHDYDKVDCPRCKGKGEISGEVIYVMRQVEKATRLLRKRRDKISSQNKKRADWYRNKANAIEARGLRAADKINAQIRMVALKIRKQYPEVDMSGVYRE